MNNSSIVNAGKMGQIGKEVKDKRSPRGGKRRDRDEGSESRRSLRDVRCVSTRSSYNEDMDKFIGDIHEQLMKGFSILARGDDESEFAQEVTMDCLKSTSREVIYRFQWGDIVFGLAYVDPVFVDVRSREASRSRRDNKFAPLIIGLNETVSEECSDDDNFLGVFLISELAIANTRAYVGRLIGVLASHYDLIYRDAESADPIDAPDQYDKDQRDLAMSIDELLDLLTGSADRGGRDTNYDFRTTKQENEPRYDGIGQSGLSHRFSITHNTDRGVETVDVVEFTTCVGFTSTLVEELDGSMVERPLPAIVVTGIDNTECSLIEMRVLVDALCQHYVVDDRQWLKAFDTVKRREALLRTAGVLAPNEAFTATSDEKFAEVVTKAFGAAVMCVEAVVGTPEIAGAEEYFLYNDSDCAPIARIAEVMFEEDMPDSVIEMIDSERDDERAQIVTRIGISTIDDNDTRSLSVVDEVVEVGELTPEIEDVWLLTPCSEIDDVVADFQRKYNTDRVPELFANRYSLSEDYCEAVARGLVNALRLDRGNGRRVGHVNRRRIRRTGAGKRYGGVRRLNR